NGPICVAGCRDRTWKLWDASGAELLCRKGHSDAVWAIAVSGQRVATGGYDKNIVLWDTRTGEEARRLLGHTSGISSLSFSPCGARLARSWDQSVRVWDLSSGGVLREIRKAHRSAVCSVSFFPDGQRLVSGGGGSEAKVWEIEAPEALLTLKGHTAQVNAVVVSPDGLLIATGSADFTVKIWDAASGGEVACVRGHDFLKECICRQGHR
ncbi:WD40-repeat-containing domain protein, partial [Baffinella frigidus]